mmetsp:Transcript_19406/g.54641  ORF Transcript_19406/g.54641 Transcript_19406/m.54641 type:complete len:391 (+) Transcript_19406:760-1932(+)
MRSCRGATTTASAGTFRRDSRRATTKARNAAHAVLAADWRERRRARLGRARSHGGAVRPRLFLGFPARLGRGSRTGRPRGFGLGGRLWRDVLPGARQPAVLGIRAHVVRVQARLHDFVPGELEALGRVPHTQRIGLVASPREILDDVLAVAHEDPAALALVGREAREGRHILAVDARVLVHGRRGIVGVHRVRAAVGAANAACADADGPKDDAANNGPNDAQHGAHQDPHADQEEEQGDREHVGARQLGPHAQRVDRRRLVEEAVVGQRDLGSVGRVDVAAACARERAAVQQVGLQHVVIAVHPRAHAQVQDQRIRQQRNGVLSEALVVVRWHRIETQQKVLVELRLEEEGHEGDGQQQRHAAAVQQHREHGLAGHRVLHRNVELRPRVQ